jgi:PAS domain S-box-containing protein
MREHLPSAPDLAGLRAVLEASPKAMLVVDARGMIREANSATDQFLGYERGELLEQSLEVLVPEGQLDLHGAVWATWAVEPRPSDVSRGLDLRVRREDGTEVMVEMMLAPMATTDGQMAVVSLRDMSEIRQETRLFRALLEAAPDGMVVVDGNGRIRLVNAAIGEWFGYSPDELVGQPVEVLVPERFVDEHRGFRADYASAPRARPMGLNGDLFARRKDGSEFAVEISLAPLESDDGPLVVAAVRDITERLAVAAAMREAEERQRVQEEIVRVKDEFLATLSHELRTPLASMVGFAELIADFEDLNERCQHFLEVIVRNGRRELRLVDDLLMLADISERGLTIRVDKVDLVSLVSNAVEGIRPVAEDTALAVRTALPEDPLVVACDADRMSQAVDSLLSNALKFTPHGGVVEIRVYTTDQAVHIEVADSGIGIGDVEPDRIFEPLFRSRIAVAREIPGAGMGLYIANAIVEAHEGSLSVLRSDTSGSTFAIELPLGA